MMPRMIVAEKKVVHIDYTLKTDKGEVVDASEGEPLAYLHGTGQIVPGLERALAGLEVGAAIDVIVEPADGYGDRDPEGVFGIPRTAFPPEAELEVGASFVGEDEEGHSLPVRVIAIENDTIVVDANHPLAGERLHFHVDVRAVRDATLEELTHGHAHGGDGHSH
jgi:FKBP-type peptidyl-prolyl cis-trans isomerase SlyD